MVKVIFLLAFLILSTYEIETIHNLNRSEIYFKQFLNKYNKSYQSKVEYLNRLRIFSHNLSKINEMNKEQNNNIYGITKFSDLTFEEFNSQYLTKFNSLEQTQQLFQELREKDFQQFEQSQLLQLPKEFDWNRKGAVTPVMNQGNAGSCWAFSTSDNVSGIWKNAGGNLQQLSKEELVDCAANYNEQTGEAICGVEGGWTYLALEYIKENGGLALESDYPYCAGTTCKPCPPKDYQYRYCGDAPPLCDKKCDNTVEKYAQIDGWKPLSQNEELLKKQLIENGPISVVLNGSPLMQYQGGILNPVSCPPFPSHAVLITGYGVSDDNTPYWIVKNSWGKDWGEDGYFKILRGKELCGINEYAVTAVIDSYNGHQNDKKQIFE